MSRRRLALKTKTLNIRVPEEIYDDLVQLAEYNGRTVSDICRRLMKDSLDRMDIEEELIYEKISSL